MFVAREKEMSALEGAYKTEAFQFVVVYGRRRVGKTLLLREFDMIPSRIGSWWGTDPAAKEQVDVDVVSLGWMAS